MLNGKKIVLGITGSIAAYKACYIIRGLIKAGAEVLRFEPSYYGWMISGDFTYNTKQVLTRIRLREAQKR